MAVYDWNTLLQQWNEVLLQKLDLTVYNAFVEPDITPAVVASGWLGFPGATEEQITATEQRLGVSLPPSYRTFLQTSNGFRLAGNIVPRLLSTDEIRWSRDGDYDFSELADDSLDEWDDLDRDLYAYHLPATLEVSARETIGTAIYLLNPMVITSDGEWEAFFYAAWAVGAVRFASFWDLMQKEYQDFVQVKD